MLRGVVTKKTKSVSFVEKSVRNDKSKLETYREKKREKQRQREREREREREVEISFFKPKPVFAYKSDLSKQS